MAQIALEHMISLNKALKIVKYCNYFVSSKTTDYVHWWLVTIDEIVTQRCKCEGFINFEFLWRVLDDLLAHSMLKFWHIPLL